MTRDISLSVPAPSGLSGVAATYILGAWVRALAALGAGRLVLASEIGYSAEVPFGRAGMLLLGPSSDLEFLYQRVQHRAALLEPLVGGNSRRVVEAQLQLLERAMSSGAEVSATDLVSLIAQHGTAVRHVSYGSPITLSINFGDIGPAIGAAARMLADPRGFKQRFRARNTADTETANADAEEARLRMETAAIKRQALESLFYRQPDPARASRALIEALPAGGDAPQPIEQVAKGLATDLQTADAIETMILTEPDVDQGDLEDDLWFAAP